MRTIRAVRANRNRAAALALVGAAGLALALSGCNGKPANSGPAPIVDMNNGLDPAQVNNAPVASGSGASTAAPASPRQATQQTARVLGQQAYPPAQAPSGEQYPEPYPAQNYPADTSQGGNYDAGFDQLADAGEQAIYADQPPPPLPEYQQPELSDPNDQWTPGYWNYAPQGYYWVPGAWVAPPFVGALWTPGYWGYGGGRYRLHVGFWGRHIGFYGGVPYGFGYTGRGYEGGYWNGDRFFYNNSVNRVNVNVVRNVYVRNVTVINNNRVSYNGPGGWQARPTLSDVAVLHEQRVPPMQAQFQHARAAATNRQQFFVENHGRPAVAVVAQHIAADRTPAEAMRPATPAAPVARPGENGPPGAGRQGPEPKQNMRVQQDQQRQQQDQQRQQQAAQQQSVQQQQAQQQATQRSEEQGHPSAPAAQQPQSGMRQQPNAREVPQNAQRPQPDVQRQPQAAQQHQPQQRVMPQPQQQRQPEPSIRPQEVPRVQPQAGPRAAQPQAAPRAEEAPRAAPGPQPQQARPQPVARPAEAPRKADEHPHP